MIIWRLAVAVVLVCFKLCAERAEAADALTLWYSAPAADWEREALPIGNGAMGAMVFGGVDSEQLQFNEKTLWTGGPGSVKGYDFGIPSQSMAARVAEVVADLDKQTQLSAEAVAKRIGRKAIGEGDYQSFGDMQIDFPTAATPALNYRRELDLTRGIARVRYEREGVHYLREYFASYPDDVIVMRLSADRPGGITGSVRMDVPDNRSQEVSVRQQHPVRNCSKGTLPTIKPNEVEKKRRCRMIPLCNSKWRL